MEDYQSKYTGEQVEELLDMVANGEAGGGGGIAVETDPIFSASPAASITDAKKAEWDGKQDTIADLATIRSGAEKGATALQEHQDISGKQDVITDLAAIREGASKGATALQSVPSEYGTKAWVTEQARDIANDAVGDFEAVAVEPLAVELSTLREDFDTLVSGDTTTAIKTFNEVVAFLDGIADTEDLAGIIASIEQQIAGKMDNVTLAKVATSGSYNDLSNKPTIPSAVTESTVSGWGFTKNTGTYSKPSGGIPKSDLTSEVQTSLGKADTALQSYTEQYKGTITGVSANGTSVATSGVANIPAASTSKYGVTKLSSATNSTSTTLAATASAVKAAYDLANGKQDKLVSGTNIKTINGTSILGSGDITISGGGGGGTNNYPLVKVTSYWLPNGGIQPNTYYQMTTAPIGGLEIVLATPTDTSIVNEYIVEFPVHDQSFMLIMPDDIVWVNDEVLAPNKTGTYIISIVNKIACYAYTSSTPNEAGGGGGGDEWE